MKAACEVKGDTWCRHRTPFDREKHPVCKIGIDYHQFREDVPALGWLSRMPCIGENSDARTRCPQYSGRSPEELAEEERELELHLDRIRGAMVAIREATKGRRGLQGKIVCPSCSKPLHYSVARVNGHVHARCETEHCVSFLQ